MEPEILELIRASDARGATAELLKLYGVEVYGYLRSLLKDDDADEAFARASENVLLAITGFRGEGSLRTWFYVVARHSAFQERRQESRRRGERISLWEDHLAAPVRTATLAYLSTHVQDRVAELRASLSADERELLLLRVDRKLSWDEIALICAERAGAAFGEPELKKAAARYRKQFERIKDKLRELARAAGLL